MCILFCTRTLLILPLFHLYLVNLFRSWSTQRPSFWRRLSSSHHTIWSVWTRRAHHLISPARRKPSSVISVIWNPSTAGTEFKQSNIMVNSVVNSISIFFIYMLVLSYRCDSRKKLEENTWLLSVFQLFAAWFAWLWHRWWHCHAFLEKLWRFWEISAVSHWTVTGWVRYQW